MPRELEPINLRHHTALREPMHVCFAVISGCCLLVVDRFSYMMQSSSPIVYFASAQLWMADSWIWNSFFLFILCYRLLLTEFTISHSATLDANTFSIYSKATVIGFSYFGFVGSVFLNYRFIYCFIFRQLEILYWSIFLCALPNPNSSCFIFT